MTPDRSRRGPGPAPEVGGAVSRGDVDRVSVSAAACGRPRVDERLRSSSPSVTVACFGTDGSPRPTDRTTDSSCSSRCPAAKAATGAPAAGRRRTAPGGSERDRVVDRGGGASEGSSRAEVGREVGSRWTVSPTRPPSGDRPVVGGHRGDRYRRVGPARSRPAKQALARNDEISPGTAASVAGEFATPSCWSTMLVACGRTAPTTRDRISAAEIPLQSRGSIVHSTGVLAPSTGPRPGRGRRWRRTAGASASRGAGAGAASAGGSCAGCCGSRRRSGWSGPRGPRWLPIAKPARSTARRPARSRPGCRP